MTIFLKFFIFYLYLLYKLSLYFNSNFMVFRRLYNWIKLKMLPPSICFKNRLYIERDSKTRRITSNLGLTFRNSKWTNYNRTDINLNIKFSWSKSFFIFLILLFLIVWIFNFKGHYITTWLDKNYVYSIFLMKDSIIEYFTSSVFCMGLVGGIEKFYTKMVGFLFSTRKQATQILNLKSFLESILKGKSFYYSWLKKTKVNLKKQISNLSNLFFNQTSSNSEVRSFTSQIIKFNYLFSESELIKKNFLISNIKPHHFVIKENYFLNIKKQTVFEKYNEQIAPSLSFLNSRHSWNFNQYTTINNNLKKEFLNQNSLHYLTKTNFMNFNTFISKNNFINVWNEVTSNQSKILKSNKFLYNYNILHRNSLKNSHKLTMTKSLITSGFYNDSLTNHNMWASGFLANKSSANQIVKSELQVLYKDLYNDMFFTNFLNQNSLNLFKTQLNLLSFYETSYFWYLKKFYNFNTFKKNNFNFFFKSQWNFNKNISKKQTLTLFSNKSLLKSILVNNHLINNYSCDLFQKSNKQVGSFFLKDLNVAQNDSDLFNTEDELLTLDLLTSSTFNNNLQTFSNLNQVLFDDTFNYNLKPLSKDSKLKNNSILIYNSKPKNILLLDIFSLTKFF